MNDIEVNPAENIDINATSQITVNSLKQVLNLNAIGLACKWYSSSIIPRNKVQTILDNVQNFNASILSTLNLKLVDCMSNHNVTEFV